MRRGALLSSAALLAVGLAQPAALTTSHRGGDRGVVPAAERFVLVDQPISTVDTGTYANQDFEAVYDQYDIYIADDFTVGEYPWYISAIFVNNDTWNNGCDLTAATAFNFAIYADAAGSPAGYPGGGAAAVWSLSIPPTDSRLTLTAAGSGFLDNVLLDLRATPVVVSAGTYWLLFYPTLSFAAVTCQSGRNVSDTQNGAAARVVNPGGGFGFPTVWTSVQDPGTWGMAAHDMAFRLEGVAVPVELQSFSAE
jgi:hypothetical protein